MTSPRIDVHHHIVPPAYLSAVRGLARFHIKSWSPAESLEDMDRSGVTTAMTTVTVPGFRFGDVEQTRRLVRLCNDYGARLTHDHPGRFGLFAALPLPDIDGSLAEIAYALDELKAEGIGLFTNYGTTWIGDPAYDAVFSELNRRRAVVYVHPDAPDCCKNIGMPDLRDSVIEYGTDTTRAIARVVFGGSAHRFPDVRYIWSHAGGTMPFIAERFFRAHTGNRALAQRTPNGVLHELQKFYYDTAQSAHIYAMSSLTKLVPVSQIVFGSDFPFRTSEEHVRGLKECGCFSAAELLAIDHGNVARLLPSLDISPSLPGNRAH